MGLELSEEKTGIVTIDDGFDFLGFTIQRRRKRGTNKSYVYTVPSQKSIESVRSKIAQACYRSILHQDFAELLKRLNQILGGWANYFRHGVSKSVFGTIDNYAWQRIWGWLKKKHGRRKLRDMKRRFCINGWQFATATTRLRGLNSPSDALPLPRQEHPEPVEPATLEHPYHRRVMMHGEQDAVYRSQSHVEDSFRQLKDRHVVSFSPMHHWTDDNIRVHTFTCVLALQIVHLMTRTAAKNGHQLSTRALLDELGTIEETVLLHHDGTKGRPRAQRLLTEHSKTAATLGALFDLKTYAPTR